MRKIRRFIRCPINIVAGILLLILFLLVLSLIRPIFFSTKYLEQVDHDGVKFFVLKPTAADAKEQFINIDGLRGPLVPKERSSGTIRIAAVGGSFTFGAGLATQETLPYLLERRLDAASPCRVEVINFAVPGMGLDAYPIWLQEKVKPYHVDYLFFQVDPYMAGLHSYLGRSYKNKSFEQFLLPVYMLWDSLMPSIGTTTEATDGYRNYLAKENDFLASQLIRIKQTCVELEVPCAALVWAIKTKRQTPLLWAIHNVSAQKVEDAEMPAIRTWDRLARHSTGELNESLINTHPTALVNDEIAQAITIYFTEPEADSILARLCAAP